MSNLWLPPGVDPPEHWKRAIEPRRPKWICRVPTAEGICGHPFYEGEERARDRHAAACAQANHEHVAAAVERAQPSIFKAWDKERYRWQRERAAGILSGRIKP